MGCSDFAVKVQPSATCRHTLRQVWPHPLTISGSNTESILAEWRLLVGRRPPSRCVCVCMSYIPNGVGVAGRQTDGGVRCIPVGAVKHLSRCLSVCGLCPSVLGACESRPCPSMVPVPPVAAALGGLGLAECPTTPLEESELPRFLPTCLHTQQR